MHFYPGLAEYAEAGKDPYRVYLNEDTIRAMDPTFAGRPVFVQHVEEVTTSMDQLRKEADGWVLESFYNAADGKHWVKFIAVTEQAERVIKMGWRLSNAYFPTAFSAGGQWNGIAYQREITAGEYEHLAIVPNPRYEESVVMSPEQFKKYNADKEIELKRLANEKELHMAFNLFKRAKVDNAADLLSMSVFLPKAKKEILVEDLLKEADERLSNAGSPMMAHPESMVKMSDSKMMTIKDMMNEYGRMCDELEKSKKPEAPDESGDPSHGEVSKEGEDKLNEGDDDAMVEDSKKNEEEDPAKAKKEMEAGDKKESEERARDEAKKANAKAKAEALRNAEERANSAPARVIVIDKTALGKARYGS
jgi:hypothetical protein